MMTNSLRLQRLMIELSQMKTFEASNNILFIENKLFKINCI